MLSSIGTSQKFLFRIRLQTTFTFLVLRVRISRSILQPPSTSISRSPRPPSFLLFRAMHHRKHAYVKRRGNNEQEGLPNVPRHTFEVRLTLRNRAFPADILAAIDNENARHQCSESNNAQLTFPTRHLYHSCCAERNTDETILQQPGNSSSHHPIIFAQLDDEPFSSSTKDLPPVSTPPSESLGGPPSVPSLDSTAPEPASPDITPEEMNILPHHPYFATGQCSGRLLCPNVPANSQKIKWTLSA